MLPMTDVHTQAQRTRNMSAIRSKDTRPEMLVRRGLHSRGFRYRLHQKALPGHPDIVMAQHNLVIFVHGCFWHGHECHLFQWPSSRADFWKTKITRNREVDAKALEALRARNWRTVTVWECALRGRRKMPLNEVLDRIETVIRSGRQHEEIVGLPTG